ncbi:2'-5' RNA ligase family protein [Candidatus Pacearchaeota archaeon]|nr:hypothetical protein [uncultured archaeon]AQS32567.1 hypothetical protein [uncultured archaeon]AQS33063.1 hypothetical protein [uncultured archaeon]MBS3074906.1 2'-5' RNA ligase family protein [Candidatus Pacearchaeota archaeon]
MKKEKRALVVFIDNRKIRTILKKYHPDYKKYKPHITLVYTFSVNDEKSLETHIKNSIEITKKFNILLKGLKKSKHEYYLYLLINKNKKKIMDLYRKLNLGILEGLKNPKLPVYIPHISLGIFKNKKQIDSVIKELKKQPIQIKFKVNKISLLTLNNDDSIKKIKNFYLK